MEKFILLLILTSSAYAKYNCQTVKELRNQPDFKLVNLQCVNATDAANKVNVNVMQVNYTEYDIVTVNATNNINTPGLDTLTTLGNQLSNKYFQVAGGINGGFFNMLTDDKYTDDICPTKTAKDKGMGNSFLISNGIVMGSNCKARPGIMLPDRKEKTPPQLINDFIDLPAAYSNAQNVISAGPFLAINGYWIDGYDNTLYPWVNIRAARSAIGFNDDSTFITLVTVDQKYVNGARDLSQGMTLPEFSQFLVEDLNIRNALNLDGGGSATMCYDATLTGQCASTVNQPSAGAQRPIRSGIFIAHGAMW